MDYKKERHLNGWPPSGTVATRSSASRLLLWSSGKVIIPDLFAGLKYLRIALDVTEYSMDVVNEEQCQQVINLEIFLDNMEFR